MIYELYDGDIQLEFDEDTHTYYLGDLVVPNVTSILDIISKPNLSYWRLNEALKYFKTIMEPGVGYDEIEIDEIINNASGRHHKISRKGRNIGSVVHNWIEDYLTDYINGNACNDTLPVNKDAAVGIKAFLNWMESIDYNIIDTERKVYSKKHNYTGTLDLIYERDNKLFIGDFKTSKRIYPEHSLQAAAYAKAFEEETGEKIYGINIIKIPKLRSLKNPKVREKEIENRAEIDRLFDVFLSALNIYKWSNGI